jgi:hypothetical protein
MLLRAGRGASSAARVASSAHGVSLLSRRYLHCSSWLASDGGLAANATPMVTQYLARKKEFPDCLLLFQVGDFYEFFGDDARRAAHVKWSSWWHDSHRG